jgi:senataxin
MGSRGRPLFDLNEPPVEDNESDVVFCFQPQKTHPSMNPNTADLVTASTAPQRIINNNAFSHASSLSGFQPFIRPRTAHGPEMGAEQKRAGDQNPKSTSLSKSSNDEEMRASPSLVQGSAEAPSVEREEGEWSDAEDSADAYGNTSLSELGKASQEQGTSEVRDCFVSGVAADNISSAVKISQSVKDENSSHTSLELDPDPNDQKSHSTRNSESNAGVDASLDGQEEPGLVPKQREAKGIEASHALKCANTLGKRKIDQKRVEMLGKKRSRQTMFLNLEDVKQAGPIKTSTPRRQTFPSPITTRSVKEVRIAPPSSERIGEKQSQLMMRDQKQVDIPCNEGGTSLETSEPKSECNGDMNSGLLGRPRRLNGDTDLSVEVSLPPIPRQSSWKQPTDSRQMKNLQVSNRKPTLISQNSMDPKLGNKKYLPPKKPTSNSTPYQDTSVERLIREVTNEKFWHHPGIK